LTEGGRDTFGFPGGGDAHPVPTGGICQTAFRPIAAFGGYRID
jgi:hypothetical protein